MKPTTNERLAAKDGAMSALLKAAFPFFNGEGGDARPGSVTVEQIKALADAYQAAKGQLGSNAVKPETEILRLRAEVERLREALQRLACLGNGDRPGNSTGNVIAQEALAGTATTEKVRYGCHCDIEAMDDGFEPDACVFDNGDIEDCVYAIDLDRRKKGRDDCEYWRPITIRKEQP